MWENILLLRIVGVNTVFEMVAFVLGPVLIAYLSRNALSVIFSPVDWI